MVKKSCLFLVLYVLAVLPLSAQASDDQPKANSGVVYGLVVDNSGSYRLLLDRVISLASGLVERNSDQDETFLVTFVDAPKINMRQELTSDKAELLDAVANMYIQGGPTAIIDGVRYAADYLAANAKRDGRPLGLIVITDGDDRSSVAKVEAVTAIAKDAKIRIFAIGVSDQKVYTKILDKMTKETGGKAFYPRTRKEQNELMDEISKAVRAN